MSLTYADCRMSSAAAGSLIRDRRNPIHLWWELVSSSIVIGCCSMVSSVIPQYSTRMVWPRVHKEKCATLHPSRPSHWKGCDGAVCFQDPCNLRYCWSVSLIDRPPIFDACTTFPTIPGAHHRHQHTFRSIRTMLETGHILAEKVNCKGELCSSSSS